MNNDNRICLIIATAVAAVFALLYLDAGQGHMALPLDDAYIYLQYARQAAQGEFLHFNTGDPVSTGCTSLLYMLVLSLVALIGYGGTLLPWASLVLALGCTWWCLRSLLALGRYWAGDSSPWTGVALFLLCGPWVAGLFSGLELALFFALFLAALKAEALGEAPWKRVILFTLLAFTRPEGQIASVIFAGAWLFRKRIQPAAWSVPLVQIFLAATPTLVLFLVSGSIIPDSVRPKSMGLVHNPDLADRVAGAAQYLVGVFKGIFMGLYGPNDEVGWMGSADAGNSVAWHFPPFALLLALTGVAARVARKGRDFLNDSWFPLLAWASVVLLLLAWQLPVGWHRHRYLLPVYPVMLLGMGLGLYELDPGKREYDQGLFRAIHGSIWIVLVSFGLLSNVVFALGSHKLAELYESRLGKAADIANQLYPGVGIAAADVGIVAFRGRAAVTDLLGVTDRNMAAHAGQGKGAVTELMASMPPTRRPDLALIQDGRADISTQAWERTGLLRRIATLPAEGAPATSGVFAWNWARIDAAMYPVASKSLPAEIIKSSSDVVNVGLLSSESSHDYFYGGNKKVLLASFAAGEDQDQMVEGGREITNGEGFTFNARPGQAAIVVGRIRCEKAMTLRYTFNGIEQEPVNVPAVTGQFQQIVLPVPADIIKSNKLRVTLGPNDLSNTPAHWASYRYWLYQ